MGENHITKVLKIIKCRRTEQDENFKAGLTKLLNEKIKSEKEFLEKLQNWRTECQTMASSMKAENFRGKDEWDDFAKKMKELTNALIDSMPIEIRTKDLLNRLEMFAQAGASIELLDQSGDEGPTLPTDFLINFELPSILQANPIFGATTKTHQTSDEIMSGSLGLDIPIGTPGPQVCSSDPFSLNLRPNLDWRQSSLSSVSSTFRKPATPAIFYCNGCDRQFTTRRSYGRHLKNCQTNVFCEICSSRFISREALNLHITLKHAKPKYTEMSHMPLSPTQSIESTYSMNSADVAVKIQEIAIQWKPEPNSPFEEVEPLAKKPKTSENSSASKDVLDQTVEVTGSPSSSSAAGAANRSMSHIKESDWNVLRTLSTIVLNIN